MKKIITLFCFILTMHSASAQSKRVDSLKTLLSNTTQPMHRYKLLSEIAKDYYYTGVGENSADNNLEMLRIALKQKNDSLIAVSYNRAGDYYLFEKSDFNTALDYFYKGIPYAEKSNNRTILSSIYIDISIAHFWAVNPKEQLSYLKKAEENLPEATYPEYNYILLQLKLNYAIYYLSLQQPGTAMPYLNVANELNLSLNHPVFNFFIKSAFANLYDQMGDTDLATVYFKKALEIDSLTVYPFAKFAFKNYYTNSLIKTGNYSEAAKQAKEILAIGERSENNAFKFFATGLLKTIYDKQNRLDSAYYYSKLELALRDTIFSQERLNKTQAFAFNEEIRITEEQRKKAEADQERKHNIQYALIALGIIVLLTLYLLLSRSFITNTKLIKFFGVIALLIVFEFLNLLLHPFLERITNHSPVLMLLALVCIAALLVPLHHKLEHWATTKMVEKNKKIRLAAAKKTVEELEKNNSTT